MINLPHLQRSLFVLPLLFVTGCAGLMMSVDERSGSDANVSLAPGATVAVSSPTVADGLDGVVSKSFGSGAEFARELQKAMIAALVANGVAAVAGDSAAGGTLAIHITEFSSGSGAARVWLSGSGVGDSALEGEASLTTPAGKRLLEIRKTGSMSGASQGGDQTRDNIAYFATALAEAIVKSS